MIAKVILKLEGHSVERIYLRQRYSDGSVNNYKTILKPRLALAARRQYVYVGFPDVKMVKFCVAAHLAGSLGKAAKQVQSSVAYTISEKAIRFRHPDYDPDRAQKLVSSSMSRHLSTHSISSKSMHAFLSNLANRQTDKQTRTKTCTSSFAGGNEKGSSFLTDSALSKLLG